MYIVYCERLPTVKARGSDRTTRDGVPMQFVGTRSTKDSAIALMDRTEAATSRRSAVWSTTAADWIAGGDECRQDARTRRRGGYPF